VFKIHGSPTGCFNAEKVFAEYSVDIYSLLFVILYCYACSYYHSESTLNSDVLRIFCMCVIITAGRRTKMKLLHILEQTTITDGHNSKVYMVKEYVRAGAGRVVPSSNQLRPPPVLLDTMLYMTRLVSTDHLLHHSHHSYQPPQPLSTTPRIKPELALCGFEPPLL